MAAQVKPESCPLCGAARTARLCECGYDFDPVPIGLRLVLIAFGIGAVLGWNTEQTTVVTEVAYGTVCASIVAVVLWVANALRRGK